MPNIPSGASVIEQGVKDIEFIAGRKYFVFVRSHNTAEQFYLPAIAAGLAITLKHLRKLVSGKTKVTMQYPEQRWDSQLPPWFRGAPALVKDEHDKKVA